jgi:hypothetical protein
VKWTSMNSKDSPERPYHGVIDMGSVSRHFYARAADYLIQPRFAASAVSLSRT